MTTTTRMTDTSGITITSLPSMALSLTKELPTIPALYFCVSGGQQILFIGIAGNLNQRFASHHKAEQMKNFPHVKIHWLELKRDELSFELEQQFIQFHDPVLNRPKTTITAAGKTTNAAIVTDSGFEQINFLISTAPICAKIYLFLAQRINPQNLVTISREQIATDLDLKPNNVRTAIASLTELGIITQRHHSPGLTTFTLRPTDVSFPG
ncbi:hypothetical protein H6G04_27685 [Calothrix membranacea FACHB-236]|nr:hypothetical protein [Calothrix membranacea FACHB-236]